MGQNGQGTARWNAIVLILIFASLFAASCAREQAAEPPARQAGAPLPIVRVRVLEREESVKLRVTAAPTVKTALYAKSLRLNMAAGKSATLALTPKGWTIGGVAVPGSGILTITPSQDASLSVNGRAYHGSYRFVPTRDGTFDVINDVDIDSYLKGVLARELLSGWAEETYRAQDIAARTYALYVAGKTKGSGNWDLSSDERSQVYGGVTDETAMSRKAVDDTAGIVLAYGQPGRERIFKAYYSACCGGVTQSAADAFGENYVVPLSDQDARGLCRTAPRFNWAPVEITKAELTRRLQEYGRKRRDNKDNDPLDQQIQSLSRLEIQSVNRFNRPIRFVAIDADGTRYSLLAEELRNAINRAGSANIHSTFMKVVNEPGSEVIRFVEGHGDGHGVGMCQWCSQIRAQAGMQHEDIVLSAFPRSKLVRAY